MSSLLPIWQSDTHHIIKYKNGTYVPYSGEFRGGGNIILMHTRFLDKAHKAIEDDISSRRLGCFFLHKLVPTFAKREFEYLVR